MKITREEVQNALTNVKVTFDDVMTTDDHVIKQTNNLEMAVLNLDIEGARSKVPTIKPIAERIEQVIVSLRNGIKKLVTDHRKDLPGSLKTIENYIEYAESEMSRMRKALGEEE